MRAERLLALIALLQVRGRATATELALELEVSERTIYRDLEALGRAGFPIMTDRGPGGGCALLPSYRNRAGSAPALKPDEARALMLSGLPSQAAELGFGALLAAGQRKLLAALPRSVRDTALRATARFHLDADDWFQPAVEHPRLAEVARLVWEERAARFAYERGDGTHVERVGMPLGLVLKAGVWYLVAGVDGQARTYRVSRILDVAEAEAAFVRDPEFDLASYWRASAEQFEASLDAYPVVVRLSPEIAPHAERLLGDPVRRAGANASTGEPDGWERRRLVFERHVYAVRAVLGLGADVEVVEPAELRDAVADAARVLVERHAHAR